ncbi:hypothetical protein H6P81_014160 [Aristolochia fimbriata]|uniref:Uncharacterized protein n=1 Tax=Aristolochia fimbriata TaxID=158543 RepID=A0AAV7EKD7_ARIFI|nr:hypothetical protein H6P81_014160 [Aristolochia fimbriata]
MEAPLNLRHHRHHHHLSPKAFSGVNKLTPTTRQSVSFHHHRSTAFPSFHLDAKPRYVVRFGHPGGGPGYEMPSPDEKSPPGGRRRVLFPASLVDAIATSKGTSPFRMLWSEKKPSLRTLYLTALWGPNATMEAVEAVEKAHRDPNFAANARKEFREMTQSKLIDWDELRRAARKMVILGKEAQAITILDKIKNQDKNGHDAREASMLMAEMLIYQGKSGLHIANRCPHILEAEKPEEFQPTDARPHLLLAVALAMHKDGTDAARDRWEEYVRLRSKFSIAGEGGPMLGPEPPTEEDNESIAGDGQGPMTTPTENIHSNGPPTDFEQFMELVGYLQHEI